MLREWRLRKLNIKQEKNVTQNYKLKLHQPAKNISLEIFLA